MAFQLAYYRLHGQIPPTYEAASTKSFCHGRTETIRSASPEAALWVKFMSKENQDIDTSVGLFRSAVENHVNLARSAASGQGVDRHLLALRLLSKELGVVHPLFESSLFNRSGSWTLSTR